MQRRRGQHEKARAGGWEEEEEALSRLSLLLAHKTSSLSLSPPLSPTTSLQGGLNRRAAILSLLLCKLVVNLLRRKALKIKTTTLPPSSQHSSISKNKNSGTVQLARQH